MLAIVRLRRTESTTLAMKESHREVIRGKVANITARHWQRKTHNTQAFKPAVCHLRAARRTLRESKPLCATPRAARRTLRESNLGPLAQSLFNTTMPRGLDLNGKKRLYRTTDWAWKGVCRNQKHNAQHPPNPPTKPAAKPPNNPPN